MDSCIKRAQVERKDGQRLLDHNGRRTPFWLKIVFGFYRYLLGPFVHAVGGAGFGCRYSPSCSHYAEQAFRQYSFFQAFRMSVMRIIRCNPWINAPYFDPLPSAARKVRT